MNGLLLLVGPRSRKRTRSEFAAASFMYSTILSHRASLLSAPTLKPRNCSGDCSGPAAVATRVDNTAKAAANTSERRLIMGQASGRATRIFRDFITLCDLR